MTILERNERRGSGADPRTENMSPGLARFERLILSEIDGDNEAGRTRTMGTRLGGNHERAPGSPQEIHRV